MLFSRNKPEWLYRAMPALYLTAGIAVIAFERNPIGLASGALLIAAAATILLTRTVHRRRHAEAENSRLDSVLAPPSRLAATTELVRAIAPPKLGHAVIDRQHRSLASRSASLRVALLHRDDEADIELLLHELVDAFALHLREETEAMRRLGVARTDAAIEADRSRMEVIARDIASFQMGGMTLAALVERVAGDLVTSHLTCPHPPLPSMESALRQLRESKT